MDKQTEFPFEDSTPVRGRVKTNQEEQNSTEQVSLANLICPSCLLLLIATFEKRVEPMPCLGTSLPNSTTIVFFKPISAAGPNIWPCHGCQDCGNLAHLLKSAASPGHHLCTINSTISCTNGPLFLVQMIKTPPSHPLHLFTRPLLQHPVPILFSPRPLF